MNKVLTDKEIQETLQKLNTRTDNQNGEEWRHMTISYFISNIGRVYNLCTDTDIKLSQDQSKQGYLYFKISLKGENRKKIYIHRAVYFCFGKYKDKMLCPESKVKLIVHHISLNKWDFSIDNLYLMPEKWHKKLHADLKHGKIKLTDVDTAEKLDEWLLLHTNILDK